MALFDYQIDPKCFADWQSLHDLLIEAFAYMEGRIDPPSSLKALTPALLREKADQETLILVRHGGKLAGCGFLKETENTLYLGKLAVRGAFQRKGILKSMVALAEKHARECKLKALELEARIELTENHATFGALGFVKSGETSHAGYDRPTSITMVKTL